jgi:hypothetical protein
MMFVMSLSFLHSSSGAYQLVFEGTRGPSYLGDIGLDDIGFSNYPCSSTPGTQGSTAASCNFEDQALCSFHNTGGDNFDWSWKAGATPSASTGPQYDHTYGTPAGMRMKTLLYAS